MRNIDILFIGGSFPMPKAGGSMNYVYHLLSGIDDLHYVVLTSDYDHQNNIEFDKNYGHKIIRNKYILHLLNPKPGNFIVRNLRLIAAIVTTTYYLVRIRPKIVFFTEYSFLSISYFLTIPFLTYKLGIFTYSEEINMILNNGIHRSVLKMLLRKSDTIVTVCEYTKRMMCDIDKSTLSKSHIIIPPVEIKTNITENMQNLKLGRILLTVARLEERKGHVDVLNVLPRLIKKYPTLEYSIVGCGSYEPEIRKKIIELGLEGRVNLKGRLSDDDLIEEYKKADIFVMPHKELNNGNTEGCPTVFLEAGLYGLPVVGGEAGGVSDAIKHGVTGFICHIDTDELYEYLDKLLSSPCLRRMMGENGVSYASQFSTKSQSVKFRNIILSLMNK